MKFGIVVFPGTWSERDCHHAIGTVLHHDVSYVWHKDTDLSGLDAIILPGGFSYGDYLRPGAIARFSPVMKEVAEFAKKGKFVFGICNGFQILCEAGLLPGALLSNNHLEFRCQWVNLRVETDQSVFSARCRTRQVLRIPISHYDGNYYADESTLQMLEDGGRVVFRYCDSQGETSPQSNPYGSLHNIAGIMNKHGNVLGMMPHPERACEELLGGSDGNLLFESLF
jgi:phosphoribosylformylglycinamidine synthase I